MDTIYHNESGLKDKSFEDRARDFLTDLKQGKGYTMIRREPGHDVRELKVGIDNHAGLVFKEGDVGHAREASRIHNYLAKYFKERGYEPYNYYLVKPKFIAVGEQTGIIQEYFIEPSLRELIHYLNRTNQIEKREINLGRELTPEEMKEVRIFVDEDSRLRCDRFLKKQANVSITLEQMIDVERVFTEDANYFRFNVKPSNLIVLDQIKDKDLERVGLAIIDD